MVPVSALKVAITTVDKMSATEKYLVLVKWNIKKIFFD
jgi:hypothetical protein